MPSNYKSLAGKIRSAKNKREIKKISKIADALYDLGLLTTNELSKLDSIEIDALIRIRTKERRLCK